MQHTPFILIFILTLSCGPSLAQEVISAGGNHHENSSAMISYSLGETVTFTGTSTENTLTQGFHQSNLTVTGVEKLLSFDVKVFPNPTSDRVIVQFDQPQSEIRIDLYDAAGRIVDQQRLTQNQLSFEFDLSKEAAGNYVLNVQDASSRINSYHLIKTN